MSPIFYKIWKALHMPKLAQLGIVRMIEDKFLIGVTGVILNDKHEVLLLKHTYRQVSWSLPGGYLKSGEHPREGLEREIEEETGLIVSADRRFKIRTDRETARLDIVYTGLFIGGTFKPSAEVTEAGFFTMENLPSIRHDQLILIEKIFSRTH